MDLHLTRALPSAEEKTAVDKLLGPPASGWEGGARQIGRDDRAAFGGHAKRAERHMLLPALHAVQARIGWISQGALNYVAQRLDVAPAEVHGVASFYGMFSLEPKPPVVAHVCDDIGCLAHGAEKVCKNLEAKLGPAGSPCLDGKATWQRSACLGACERAPAALVVAAGEKPRERVVAPADAVAVEALLRDAVAGKLPTEPDELITKLSVPQAGNKDLRLLRRMGQGNAASLDDYKGMGGY